MIACGRVHLGPIKHGSHHCQCCGKTITAEERLRYWRVRLVVKRMICDALERYVVELKKKTNR